MRVRENAWERSGGKKGLKNFDGNAIKELAPRYDFISFESWEEKPAEPAGHYDSVGAFFNS
jgi:hypothetical protein